MPLLEILPHLPLYGPPALPFPEDGQGAFREGLVVRFTTGEGPWVGNFQRGHEGLDFVIEHPDGCYVVVIAGGQGYIVDPKMRRQAQTFGGQITFAMHAEHLQMVLVGDLLRISALTASGFIWETERLSWDGLRSITVQDNILHGEAWTPMPDSWHSFAVNLLTGEAFDAIYKLDMERASGGRPASTG